MALLEVRDLKICFTSATAKVSAVNGISFDVTAGETLGIVGESGSGKSQTVLAIMGLLAKNGTATGSVKLDGQEILNLGTSKLNKIRANEIAMIFQDPMSSLNPYLPIAHQMTEVLTHHKGSTKKQALNDSVEMLDALRIPDAKSRIKMYPHEFSGGMQQRVMIAMALMCRPKILIADEPTTALDVTVQAQIMAILNEIRKELGMAMILISHDLGIIAGSSHDALVMYGGQAVEYTSALKLFQNPTHPYTKGLLKAVPRLDQCQTKLETIPGNPPNMPELPTGCAFYPRCQFAAEICAFERPRLSSLPDDPAHMRSCLKSPEHVQ